MTLRGVGCAFMNFWSRCSTGLGEGPDVGEGSVLVMNTLLTDGVESGEDADTRRHEGSVRELLTTVAVFRR